MTLLKNNIINALYSALALLICVLLGRATAYLLPLLPSSLYGLIIFTLALHFRVFNAERIKSSVVWSIKHMGVCFVPAGVGIINHLDLVKQHGIAIILITFSTTFLLLSAVGFLYQQYENSKE